MNEVTSVRRHELAHNGRNSASRSPSPATQQHLLSRLSRLYAESTEYISASVDVADEDHSSRSAEASHSQAPPGESEEYAFRLFSSKSRTATHDRSTPVSSNSRTISKQHTEHPLNQDSGVVRVRVESQSPTPDGPGGIISARPESYYFSAPASPESLEQLKRSAISGELVRAQATQPWPGCALPWRVHQSGDVSNKKLNRHMAVTNTTSSKVPESMKRRRLGKKRRRVLRRRAQEKKDAEQKQHKLQEDKEAAANEKRVRLNRAKNVRRRAKEKAKKSALKEDQGNGSRDEP